MLNNKAFDQALKVFNNKLIETRDIIFSDNSTYLEKEGAKLSMYREALKTYLSYNESKYDEIIIDNAIASDAYEANKVRIIKNYTSNIENLDSNRENDLKYFLLCYLELIES